jgi:hypothetical protein
MLYTAYELNKNLTPLAPCLVQKKKKQRPRASSHRRNSFYGRSNRKALPDPPTNYVFRRRSASAFRYAYPCELRPSDPIRSIGRCVVGRVFSREVSTGRWWCARSLVRAGFGMHLSSVRRGRGETGRQADRRTATAGKRANGFCRRPPRSLSATQLLRRTPPCAHGSRSLAPPPTLLPSPDPRARWWRRGPVWRRAAWPAVRCSARRVGRGRA